MENKNSNIIVRTPQKKNGVDTIKKILKKENKNKNKRKRSSLIQLTFFDGEQL